MTIDPDDPTTKTAIKHDEPWTDPFKKTYDEATPAGPAAIDKLKAKIKRDGEGQFGPSTIDVEQVCELYEIAVEALQDTCAGLEIDLRNSGHDNDDLRLGKEAAEAREVALAGVLEDCAELVNLWASKAGCGTEDAALKSDAEDFGSLSALRRARTVLAATPEDVMERARTLKEVAGYARHAQYCDLVRLATSEDGKDKAPQGIECTCGLRNALGKEEKQ